MDTTQGTRRDRLAAAISRALVDVDARMASAKRMAAAERLDDLFQRPGAHVQQARRLRRDSR